MRAGDEAATAYRQGAFGYVQGHEGSAVIQTNAELGANHQRLLELDTVPPIADADAAYRVGRTLRCLAVFLDQANAPATKIEEAVETVAKAAAAGQGRTLDGDDMARLLATHFGPFFRKRGLNPKELAPKLTEYARKAPTVLGAY
jgi:hypothetical protein